MKWQERKITVQNRQGIHGRVATKLAEFAAKPDVDLQFIRDGRKVDCSSVLEVLSMALVCGSEVTVRARGVRADETLDAVQKLLISQDEYHGTHS